ncbi:hypothetical protein Cgig2_004513 [Carnegiea gigantea]|uniref:mRNA decapping protein 2 Box A domain-containing protein n=1 Tax=Carnegiea gigantea TaxID=171969 RepID=A0A9Q1QDL9_9CARY|nr:hypothetical protein Cgig2_004513 [Carnegiea gigantea]
MSGLPRSSSAQMKNGLPPQELLDDLCSRFVLNVPKEDQQSFERILFLVEYAHWFYEDNSVEKNPSLKSFTLKEFTSLMFNSCEVLKPYVPHIDDIFKDFTSYKVRVPVTGAIILDETYERIAPSTKVKDQQCLQLSIPYSKNHIEESRISEKSFCSAYWLKDGKDPVGVFLVEKRTRMRKIIRVQLEKYVLFRILALSFYFNGELLWAVDSMASWVFLGDSDRHPITFHSSIVRGSYRVLEETGFDVSELLNKDDYIEVIFGQQRVRLYIIAGVSDDTAFAPQTKKEISEIAWQRLEDLQPASDEVISRGVTGLKLYMVAPFLKSLKAWISKHPPPGAPKSDGFIRGFTVWKAKNSSSGGSSQVFDPQHVKAVSDSHVSDTGPGRSFRNFKFDTPSILRAMESAFSTS